MLPIYLLGYDDALSRYVVDQAALRRNNHHHPSVLAFGEIMRLQTVVSAFGIALLLGCSPTLEGIGTTEILLVCRETGFSSLIAQEASPKRWTFRIKKSGGKVVEVVEQSGNYTSAYSEADAKYKLISSADRLILQFTGDDKKVSKIEIGFSGDFRRPGPWASTYSGECQRAEALF